MQGKRKRKISFLLAVLMFLTVLLPGNGAYVVRADGESAEPGAVNVKLTTDQSGVQEQGGKHIVHVAAQSSLQEEALLKIYLKNADGSSAQDVTVPNMCSQEEVTDATVQKTMTDTLSSAVTLADGTTAALEAEWKEDTDEAGNVTARYLQAKMPAGGSAEFDLELQYDTEEDIYDREVKAEGKAYLGENEVTKAADTEEGRKENIVTVQWREKTIVEEVTATVLEATTDSDYTAEQIQAIQTYLEENPNSVLLDTTGMNANSEADWTGTDQIYACLMKTGSGNVWKSAARPETLAGTNIYAFELGTQNDSYNMIFTYEGSDDKWDTLNGKDFYKTQSYSVSSAKGKIYRCVGEDTYPDTGKKFYTLETVIFENSPLHGKDVYLNTENITGMATPPIIRITDGAGKVTDVTMENCYNQPTVFRYKFAGYVLPNTTFQFVSNDGAVVVPEIGVSDVNTETPCFDGTSWVAYTPEASTIRISVVHPFADKGGARVVFTKDGSDVESTCIDLGTASGGSFEFDMEDTSYDGFYIRQKDDDKEGNKTVVKSENEIREAVNTYGTPLTATVGDWKDENTKRNLTFGAYVSLADSSLNIPKTNKNFQKDPALYYVNSTFYDYYSDEEIQGKNRKNLSGNFIHDAGSSDKVQAGVFNKAIGEYFKNTSLATTTYQSPLYFGELTNAKSITDRYLNFIWENNNGEPNRVDSASAARQGLVNSSLENNQLVMGTDNTIAPYFNSSFLRGANSTNSEVGYVFDNVQFPFVKNSEGYWEFNSYDSAQTLRMKQDVSGTYYLDRVGADNAVHGMTMYDGKTASATNQSNFFPFNDASESCSRDVNNAKRLNYAFGTRLDIPFYMTSDGKVKVTNEQNVTTEKDIVFDFSGDDDVWIFIDGKLVLDIGGDHGAVAGNINFAEGKATTTAIDTGKGTPDFGKLDSTKQHTLTMFYMERGLWESNMKVTFNFPQSNQLEVEKEVVVPTALNSYFSGIKTVLEKETSFPVTIKNKVTSGETKTITGETLEVDNIYDSIDGNTRISLNTPKNSSVLRLEDGANRQNVLRYYYPGEKKANEGQSVTDGRSFYITGHSEVNLDTSQMKDHGYLQFEAYVDDGASASSPFIALIDDKGNRVGAWASGAVNGGGSNSMGSRSWKTLQVSFSKLKLLTGTTFDYGHVTKIQFAYWNDVTIYLDNFRIKAPAMYTATTGFTKEQKDISDYKSYESGSLEPVNGAEYVQTGNTDKQWVDSGRIYLKNRDSAVFSDQFRRESYLSLTEDCDPTIFDTVWNISEDDVVRGSGSGTSVTDNRTEPSPEHTDDKYGKPVTDTMLFKSYNDDGESVTTFFDLNVKYTNTLKLGNLQIQKRLSDGQVDNGDDYTFVITFSNVAGMSLESKLTTPLAPITVEMKANETKTISGIPAGTHYEIREVKQDGQEYTLMKMEQTSGNDTSSLDLAYSSVSGTVTADETDAFDVYTFTNDINPSVQIEGTKIWESVSPSNMPMSVTLKLERKLNGQEDTAYEPALDMNGQQVPELVVTNDTDWKFIFNNVPKYNGTGADKIPYIYRVVETKVDDRDPGHAGYLVTGGTQNDQGNYDITNKYQNTGIRITKVDSGENKTVLPGVEFKLERLDEAGNVDEKFPVKDGTTDDKGICEFKELSDGIYLLTETKAREGYSLLKEPVRIELNRGGICKVDGENYEVIDGMISFTIGNRLKFFIPATGGYGSTYMILGGLALAGAALFMYRLQMRRKGGRKPRM